jgi:hypothetical protein
MTSWQSMCWWVTHWVLHSVTANSNARMLYFCLWHNAAANITGLQPMKCIGLADVSHDTPVVVG